MDEIATLKIIEQPKIVVPSHLRRLYESAMKNYDEAQALETARNICDNIQDFDADSLKLMDDDEQKRRFAVDRMVDAMCLTCDHGSLQVKCRTLHCLTMSDLKAGFCTQCKTPIVLEWKVI